ELAVSASPRTWPPWGQTLLTCTEDERPERLELGLRVLHQGDAHMLSVRHQQVLVVARALLPALHHFLEARLSRTDILRREPRLIAGALHAVPRVGAVRAIVGDA